MTWFLKHNLPKSLDENNKSHMLRASACFTVIELCGSFLTGKTGPSTTKHNFIRFIKSEYIPKTYDQFADLLYDCFRNGVAHTYISKGGALLSSAESMRSSHLRCFKNGLLIYLPQFASDVKAGLNTITDDICSNDDLKTNYNSVIAKIIESGDKNYIRFCADNNICVNNKIIPRDIQLNPDCD